MRRTARKCLETHRTRAGEQVDDLHAVDGADQVEGCFADPVAGRAGLAAARSEDSGAFTRTRDDPHRRRAGRPRPPAGPSSSTSSAAHRRARSEKPAIPRQACEAKIGKARLPRPEQLAFSPQLEVDLGEAESVGGLDERFETPPSSLGELVSGARDEQAIRLLGPPPDAASELMELREAEPIGFLDDHDGRVRDVHSNLDHSRRDKDVELTALERIHDGAPLGRMESPVQAAHPKLPELGALEALSLLFGGARLDRLGLAHERADDVGLPAFCEMALEPGIGLGAPFLCHP